MKIKCPPQGQTLKLTTLSDYEFEQYLLKHKARTDDVVAIGNANVWSNAYGETVAVCIYDNAKNSHVTYIIR